MAIPDGLEVVAGRAASYDPAAEEAARYREVVLHAGCRTRLARTESPPDAPWRGRAVVQAVDVERGMVIVFVAAGVFIPGRTVEVVAASGGRYAGILGGLRRCGQAVAQVPQNFTCEIRIEPQWDAELLQPGDELTCYGEP